MSGQSSHRKKIQTCLLRLTSFVINTDSSWLKFRRDFELPVSHILGWVEVNTWRSWTGWHRRWHRSATGDSPFLMQNGFDSLPFGHQSILMKDHFMGTAKTV